MLTNPAYNSKLQTENNSNNKTYVNECSFLTLFSGINWEIGSKIASLTANILYYFHFNMCKLETYIDKSNRDAIEFKARMKNHISEPRTGISSFKSPRHFSQCGTKNGNLMTPFLKIKAILTTNDTVKLEYLEKHFQNKSYDTLSNPSRII